MLTAKQEAFARLVADGKQQADAYRQTYEADGMGAPSIWAEASRLTSHVRLPVGIRLLFPVCHYNTVRPHSALGYRPPAPETIVPVDPRPLMQ